MKLKALVVPVATAVRFCSALKRRKVQTKDTREAPKALNGRAVNPTTCILLNDLVHRSRLDASRVGQSLYNVGPRATITL